jgi:hypothetical protein
MKVVRNLAPKMEKCTTRAAGYPKLEKNEQNTMNGQAFKEYFRLSRRPATPEKGRKYQKEVSKSHVQTELVHNCNLVFV